MSLMESTDITPMAEESTTLDSEKFEDVTQELWKCVDEEMDELDIVVNHNTFNWEDVMSSFETMDHKMDQRLKRNYVAEQSKGLLDELENIPSAPLTITKKLALMRELLL